MTTIVWSVFAEYHFSPVHCILILLTHKIIYKNDVTVQWREMVFGENWSHAWPVQLMVYKNGMDDLWVTVSYVLKSCNLLRT